MSLPATPETQSVEHHDFMLAPRHRLFVVFDSRTAGEAAVRQLREKGFSGEDDIWVLYGEDGLRDLDATGALHGMYGKVLRLVQLGMATNDVKYLETLSDELREEHMILAIRVPEQHAADELAREMRAASGHSMAYGAHFDFVPVMP